MLMKLSNSFVSRANPKDPGRHVILGVIGYKPREFAAQMNLSLSNQWGIVRTIIDMCMSMPEGKYVLVKVSFINDILEELFADIRTSMIGPK